MKLAGKLALVTGSTRGIGRAIALRFARKGARVVVNGRDADLGTRCVEAIRRGGGRGGLRGGRRRLPGGCRADLRLGEVDVLVNNAARSSRLFLFVG